MALTKTILFILKGKDDLSGDLSKINTSAQKSVKGFESLQGKIVSLNAGFQLVKSSVTAVVGAFNSSVQAFATQEQAELKLASALKGVGNLSRETLQDFKDFASGLQDVTTVGDETTLQLAAMGTSMGFTTERTKQLITAANDLAAFSGKGINESFKQLTATTTGMGQMAGQIGRLIPEIDNLTKAELEAGKGIDLVAAKFKGLGNADATSLAGQIIQIKNAFGDLQETIGQTVLGITQIATGGKPGGIKHMINSINNGIKSLEPIFVFLGGVISTLGEIFATTMALVMQLIQTVKTAISGIGGAIGVVLKAVGFKDVGESLVNNAKTQFDQLLSDAQVTAEGVKSVFDFSEFDLKIFNDDVVDKANAVSGAVKTVGDAANNAAKELEKIQSILDEISKQNQALMQTSALFGLEGADAIRGELSFQLAAIEERIQKEGRLSDAIKKQLEIQRDLTLEIGDKRIAAAEKAAAMAAQSAVDAVKDQNISLLNESALFGLEGADKIRGELSQQLAAIQKRIDTEGMVNEELRKQLKIQQEIAITRAEQQIGAIDQGGEESDGKNKNSENLKIALIIAGAAAAAAASFGDFVFRLPEIFNNFIKNFPEILKKFVDGIGEALKTIFDNFDQIVKSIVDGIQTAILSLADALPKIVEAIVSALPKIITAIVEAIPFLVKAVADGIILLLDALPEILESILQGLPAIIISIFQAIPRIVQKIIEIVPELVETFADNIGPIAEALIAGLIDATPSLVKSLIDSIIKGTPRIIKAVIGAIVSAIKGTIKGLLGGGGGFKLEAPKALKDFPKDMEKVLKRTSSFATDQLFAVKDLKEGTAIAKTATTDPVKAVTDAFNFAQQKVSNFFADFIAKLREAWQWIYNTILKPFIDLIRSVWLFVWEKIIQPIVGAITQAWTWVNDTIIKPIAGAIMRAWTWVNDTIIKPISGLIRKAFEFVKTMFDKIAAPVQKAFKPVTDAINKLFKTPGWIKTLQDLINKLANANPFKQGGGGGGALKAIATGGLSKIGGGGKLFAEGGLVSARHLQTGGFLFEPVGTDSIPAMLSPGEFIVSKPAVDRIGTPALQSINAGQSPTGGGQSLVFNVNINASTTLDANSIRSQVVPIMIETIKRKSQDGEFVIDRKGVR